MFIFPCCLSRHPIQAPFLPPKMLVSPPLPPCFLLPPAVGLLAGDTAGAASTAEAAGGGGGGGIAPAHISAPAAPSVAAALPVAALPLLPLGIVRSIAGRPAAPGGLDDAEGFLLYVYPTKWLSLSPLRPTFL